MPSKAAQLSPPAPPPLEELVLRSWRYGVISYLNEGNIPLQGLAIGHNVTVAEDGSIQPRPQFEHLLTLKQGTTSLRIFGQVFSFNYSFDSYPSNSNWLICVAGRTIQTGGQVKVRGEPEIFLIDTQSKNYWIIGSDIDYPDEVAEDVVYRFNKTNYNYFDEVAQENISKEYIIITSGREVSYIDLSLVRPTGGTLSRQLEGHILPEPLRDPRRRPRAWFQTPIEEGQTAFSVITEGSQRYRLDQAKTSRQGPYVYSYYYRYSAFNDFGETGASEVLPVWTSTPRHAWAGDNENVRLYFGGVSGATGYNIYFSENEGSETLLASVPYAHAFIDDGTLQPFSPRQAPTNNTTGLLPVKYSAIINNRVYVYGDKRNPNYIWYGGYDRQKFLFGPGIASGYEIVGQSAQEEVANLSPFRDNTGEEVINVFTSERGGRGRRYLMRPTSTQVASLTYEFHTITETEQEGTTAPDGVVVHQNNIYYPSKTGFKTTGNKPQIQNLVSTDEITQTIRGDIYKLDHQKMKNCVGIEYRDKIYWTVPYSSDNDVQNRIWEFDLTLGGAWFKDWTFAADWLTHHDSGSNQETLLAVQRSTDSLSSSLWRLTDIFTDERYNFVIKSGYIKPPNSELRWMQLNRIYLVFDNPKPPFKVTIWGRDRSSLYQVIDEQNYEEQRLAVTSGWGTRRWGAFLWGDAGDEETPTPALFRYKMTFPLTSLVDWVGYTITGTSEAHFSLAEVLVRYVSTIFIDNAGIDAGSETFDLENLNLFDPPIQPVGPTQPPLQPGEHQPLDDDLRDFDFGRRYS